MNHLLRWILKFLILFAFWCVLSGKGDFFHLALGAGSVLLVMGINRHLPEKFEHPLHRFFPWVSFLLYLPWLFSRIVLASLHTARVVLSPKMFIDPHLIQYPTRLKTDAAQVILANSITLTPGTITGELEETLVIHALDEASAGDVNSGLMENKVAGIFKS